MKNKTLYINLISGPGAGKSTIASKIFYELKMLGLNCELVTEFAKYLTWENNQKALCNQYYVSAKQMHREYVVDNQVDVIITDSPIILGLLYYKEENENIKYHFENFIIESFKSKRNLNFFINRIKEYNPIGRNQTLEESINIDNDIKNILNNNKIKYYQIDGNTFGISDILSSIRKELGL